MPRAAPTQATRTRRLPLWASVLVPVPMVSAMAGLSWHFCSLLLRPERAVQYPERVLAAEGDRVWFAPSTWADQPGYWAVRWPHPPAAAGRTLDADDWATPVSYAQTGAVERVGTVGPRLAGPGPGLCRRWLSGPLPPPGARVAFDASLRLPDPAARDLPFHTVTVATPLGGCPAWWVPAGPASVGEPEHPGAPTADTWVIAVHGRGADRAECLRILPTLHRLGLPTLAISYRNDVDAPASPDRLYHLGDTEWQDLAAAAAHARDAGARRLVLYGWSMGAAIIAAFLDRSPLATDVAAVVWDCPLLDWRATLRQQARLRRLPRGVLELVLALTRRRIGIDFDHFDLVRRTPAVRPPTLLFHGAGDTAVPVGPARALARDHAGGTDWTLRYVEVADAEHTAPWNADPARYEGEVVAFLSEHLGIRPGHDVRHGLGRDIERELSRRPR